MSVVDLWGLKWLFVEAWWWMSGEDDDELRLMMSFWNLVCGGWFEEIENVKEMRIEGVELWESKKVRVEASEMWVVVFI